LGNKIKSSANVGMLVHGYYPKDVRVRREAEALVEAGFKVTIVCLKESIREEEKERKPSKEMVNGVYVCRLPISRKRGKTLRYFYEYLGLTLLGGFRLTISHIINPFQVIHVHNMPDFLVLSGLIPKLLGAKLLLDIHDPMPELYNLKHNIIQNRCIKKALKWEEKLCCKLADKVITVNKAVCENLVFKGIPAKKIFIVHNFPDTKYIPMKKDITHWPRHKNGFVLLYAGTVTEHYRLDIAINALALVVKDITSIKLRILGDGNELEHILNLANKLGIKKYVEHLKPVKFEEVKEIMASADVGITCHSSGIFGNLYFATKIFDYLTQGLPVISSRTKTVQRYIPDNSIFYFEPGNFEEMAKRIKEIWSRPDLVREKMKNAQKLLKKYSWTKEKIRFINFYQGLTK